MVVHEKCCKADSVIEPNVRRSVAEWRRQATELSTDGARSLRKFYCFKENK